MLSYSESGNVKRSNIYLLSQFFLKMLSIMHVYGFHFGNFISFWYVEVQTSLTGTSLQTYAQFGPFFVVTRALLNSQHRTEHNHADLIFCSLTLFIFISSSHKLLCNILQNSVITLYNDSFIVIIPIMWFINFPVILIFSGRSPKYMSMGMSS